MKIFLFATGEFHSKNPLTELVPSPMFPLANRPVMEHLVEMLARQNFKRIFASLYFQAGQIERYFGSGLRWGVHLEYHLQRDPLGTAGSIGRARRDLDETFLFLPADILIDLDVQAALADHGKQGNTATVISAMKGLQPTGAYLLEPRALSFIPARTPFDLHTQLLPALASAGQRVGTHALEGIWHPLDTLEGYQSAQTLLLRKKAEPKEENKDEPGLRFYRVEGRQIYPGVWVNKNVSIHPSAQLTPPVHIGANSHIGPGVELGPGALIGHNVVVDQGATIRNSTVFDHTYVGQLINIDERIVRQNLVIDLFTKRSLQVADRFLLDSLEARPDNSWTNQVLNHLGGLILLTFFLPLALLVGLLVWMSTQQVFDLSPRIKPKTDAQRRSQPNKTRYFHLRRFNAYRKDGSTTHLTRWLDRWNLLRLPELWNVVKGDMNIVGIYPLPTEWSVHITEPWQEKLREVQPGFTGLWFVQAPRYGDLLDLQVIDAYYAATRTAETDLQLLLKTPAAWLRHQHEWRPSALQTTTGGQVNNTIPLQPNES